MSEEFILVGWLGLVLAAAFLGGFGAKKIKQPAVVGYLTVGILLSFLASRFLSIKDTFSFFSEIGIAFLMFTLGLELSLDFLRRVKTVALWGAIIQILLVIILAIFILPLLGFDFISSLLIGCAFSLSSTAIVVKLLAEKGETETLPGEIMMGWLLVQDLAVLPMVVILPSLSAGHNFGSLLLAIVKAAVILTAVWFLGKTFAVKFIAWVADFKSRELLLIAVVSLCLLTAILTSALGLSLALGAFLAGLVVSKSSENHAVFTEIRPLRDLFSIIFFISLGMFLNPYFLFSNLPFILVLSLGLMLIKFLIVGFLVFWLGYHLKTSLLVGLGLTQVGEFAFILSHLGQEAHFINDNTYSLILSVALVSILATPWLMALAPKLYFVLQKKIKRFPGLYQRLLMRQDKFKEAEGLELENHVVICGHGRVGSWLARALNLLEVPHIVIDYNHRVISDLKSKGIRALYGDPADIDVLDYAQADKAKIVVVAIPDQATQELVVTNCQTLNPQVKIISRIHQKDVLLRLKSLGVTYLIQPEFEAALSIIHRVLQFFGFDKQEIQAKIKRLKIEHGMN